MAEIIQIYKGLDDELTVNTKCQADDLYSASVILMALYLKQLPEGINKGVVMMQFLEDLSLLFDEEIKNQSQNGIIIPGQSVN